VSGKFRIKICHAVILKAIRDYQNVILTEESLVCYRGDIDAYLGQNKGGGNPDKITIRKRIPTIARTLIKHGIVDADQIQYIWGYFGKETIQTTGLKLTCDPELFDKYRHLMRSVTLC